MQRKQRLLASWSLLAVGALGLAGTGALAGTGLIHAAPADYIVTNCKTSNSGGVLGSPAVGDLEYAVDTADGTPGTITFDCAPGSQISVLDQLLVTNAYTVNGLTTDGKTPIILDGGNAVPIMAVIGTGSGTLTVENVTLQHGHFGTSFGGNTAQGGAIYIKTGTVDLADDSLVDNTAINDAGASNAYVSGGAVYDQGTLTIDHSTFTGNTASSPTNCAFAYGGAIDVEGSGVLSIKDHSTFTGNQAICGSARGSGFSADAYGGALYDNSRATTDSIADSTFSNNEAVSTGTSGTIVGSYGGAVDLVTAMGAISGSSFTDNSVLATTDTGGASAYGGGADTNEGTSLTGTTFSGNKAVGTATGAHGLGEAYGGGLYTSNYGTTTFTVTGNTFSGNQANGTSIGGEGGGMYNYAVTTETADTYTGNSVSGPGAFGGAIANGYTLTLNASTISGNSATGEPEVTKYSTQPTYGGGIANYYILSIDNSTISGNTVSGTDSGGGGIDNFTSSLEIADSTIVGNKAEGTGSQAGGLDTTTFVSSGTPQAAQTAIGGSIVAGNTAPTSPDCSVDSGSKLVDNGYNLESATDCFGKTPAKGDKQNVSNPGLASKLANNGGPTQTLALLAGSPAIDQIPTTGASGSNNLTSLSVGPATFAYALCPGSPAQDQRGVKRPQGSACDMGAYEYQPSAATAPTTGLSGNGAPSAPITALAPSGSTSASTTRNGHARTLPAQPKVVASTHVHTSVSTVSSGFPLALAILLAILCFGLMGGGAVLLVRTRKVDGR